MATSPVLEQLQKRAAVQRPGTDPNRINQPTLYGQPAPGTPSVVGSQGKAPGEWVGSRYVGPTAPAAGPASPAPAPPAAPVNTPAMPPGNPQVLPAPNGDAGYRTDWGGGNVAQQQQQIGDASRAAAPLGFDAAKWADPTQGTSQKYTAGRILQAGGSISDVLAQKEFQGWSPVGTDKIKSPDGNIYDLKFDVGGANERTQYTLVGGPRWNAEQNNGYQGNVGGVTGLGTPGHPFPTTTAAPGGTGGAGSAPGGSFQDQTRALLMAQMQGLSGPVTANDPAIKAAMDAARLESERGVDQTRKDQAERMFAEGSLNSNALGQAVQQSRERGATGLSTLQGDLMMRETTAKRASLAQMLQLATQTGDNESARALTLRLNEMDNAIRRQQLAQQGSQWNDSYGLQVNEAQRQRDLDASRARLGQPL